MCTNTILLLSTKVNDEFAMGKAAGRGVTMGRKGQERAGGKQSPSWHEILN